ncbi:MAG: lysoplasmalogenase [Anaerolineae bacterium CFX3]|jgi:uncharacterized membrane protein YhhN|nr:lysoplasmalogenase [Anaerolineae bacterium CFX3]MCQ3945620.1 hypothetical protein [Anaerolineae bacterium]RIK28099.1 MAG: hypothetical protein DCC54_00970 [Anaerolineae bacterium]
MLYLFAALIFAALTAWATWKQNRGLEMVAKPAVMIILLAYVWGALGLEGAAVWFLLGMFFSLVGDMLLLSLDRLFSFGLAAFLLAQVFYIFGFNSPASPVSLWGLILALVIGLGSARVLKRILSALAAQGQANMRIPIVVYGAVISLMLLSAMLKLSDPAWKAGASALAAAGAFLFFLSDIVLAWLKFVTPIQNGRVINIGLYHLGQMCIAAGLVMQLA